MCGFIPHLTLSRRRVFITIEQRPRSRPNWNSRVYSSEMTKGLRLEVKSRPVTTFGDGNSVSLAIIRSNPLIRKERE